ncbi:HAD family hydrolase [Hathewaya massiliensis]|uniref:HAD family hydrolase n=1 Tax=Hathewaya massiliensis TaxID=1964382 RepID=UPI00115AC7DA|nr:HAD family phosphatase [Hathewaya massiliensis]
MLREIKGVIFDLDGTLVDSMWIWEKIDIDYLKAHNKPLPKDLRCHIEHLSFEETSSYFKQRFNLPYTEEEIQNQWFEMAIKEYSTNVPLKAGVKNFLKILKAANIKIALATSNCKPLINACLKAHGIEEYFHSITTTSEVTRGKNFPDVYLLAAERLDVAPKNCVVFEDILPAIKGAKSAGMRVVGVYDDFSKLQEEEIKSIAHKYIYNYEELINII